MEHFGCSNKNCIYLLVTMMMISLIVHASPQSSMWCHVNAGRLEYIVHSPKFPVIPDSFTTRIQVNYESHGFTSEIIRKVDRKNTRDYIEMKNGSQHILNLSLKKDDAFLTIIYKPEGATCTTEQLSQADEVFGETESDARSLLEIVEEIIFTDPESFSANLEKHSIRGIDTRSWQTCQFSQHLDTAIDIKVYFSDASWISSHPYFESAENLHDEIVRIRIEARGLPNKMKNILATLDFYDYQPKFLEEQDFQIPESVHCPNYRKHSKGLADFPNYFSYMSEITQFLSSSGQDAVVNHRTVHYSYDAGLARVDYQGAESKDFINSLNAIVRTYIYDFNTGLQYTFDPIYGTCKMEPLESIMDVSDKLDSPTLAMLKPLEFFHLDVSQESQLSFNGIYETRGLPAYVFSRRLLREKRDMFWYFSSDQTKVIGEVLEKNVLVKIISRPETGQGKIGSEGQIDINLYNFKTSLPSEYLFDISPCYNESLKKEFIITLSGMPDNHVEESLYLFKHRFRRAIQAICSISQPRVIIQQIDVQTPYLLIQFIILGLPPVQGVKPIPDESDLEKAVYVLQQAIDKNKFHVEFPNDENKVIVLRPEEGGLKEFKVSRSVNEEEVFHESSFIGMAIGMAVLGFLLGGIVVNLIVTRKYGVSLLQSDGAPASSNSFENPLHESPI